MTETLERLRDVEQDWGELADLIDESYRTTAPTKALGATGV